MHPQLRINLPVVNMHFASGSRDARMLTTWQRVRQRQDNRVHDQHKDTRLHDQNNSQSVVFIHVGENDLRALGCGHPSSISSEIINLAQVISQQVPCVYIRQLLPFSANEVHRKTVIWINSALQSAFQSSASVQYKKHRGGFWKPPTAGQSETPLRQIFAENNVHLSKGHVVYWHSMRLAITKALHSQNLM